jgi:L-alanine-DL-glutamate epimerase-like enolase superfamily enzyme
METDEGIIGWGEPILEGRADTVAACVQEISEYVIGKDPLRIGRSLAGIVSRRLLPWGAHSDECHLRYRTGIMGHQRQVL